MKRLLLGGGAFVATLAVLAPAAWAVGWTTVDVAGVHFNETGGGVRTANPVYSSELRLYVSTHSPCGSPYGTNNFFMQYVYPDGGTIYAESSDYEICTAAESPTTWNEAGGNKYAECAEIFDEYTDPSETCQRYSTT